jgi:hypothetical protein
VKAKRFAVWAPWVKKFFTLQGGKVFITEDEAKAKRDFENLPGWPYKVVPWDEVAERMHRGEAV